MRCPLRVRVLPDGRRALQMPHCVWLLAQMRAQRQLLAWEEQAWVLASSPELAAATGSAPACLAACCRTALLVNLN